MADDLASEQHLLELTREQSDRQKADWVLWSDIDMQSVAMTLAREFDLTLVDPDFRITKLSWTRVQNIHVLLMRQLPPVRHDFSGLRVIEGRRLAGVAFG
jgi:hypothetical protein